MATQDNEPAIAIIGGTGLEQFPLDNEPEALLVTTGWGEASARVGRLDGKRVVFLARHGAGHKLPPHRINYRANIAALAKLNVRAVLATTAVGGLKRDLKPGTFVLLSDFIDFTPNRTGKTFFDAPAQVIHTDFSVPYSSPLRAAVLAAASELGQPIRPTGTYLCADGPRYETPAEVRLFATWGGDVVGMTGVPEATLAREAGLHYAGVSLVTNPGAGLTPAPLTHANVEETMAAGAPRLRDLLVAVVARIEASALPVVGPGVLLPGLEEQPGG